MIESKDAASSTKSPNPGGCFSCVAISKALKPEVICEYEENCHLACHIDLANAS
jgi:hypothetical protein